MVNSVSISLNELRELTRWLMSSDPFPIGVSRGTLEAMVNRVARQFGYQDWVSAFHAL